MVLEPGVAEDHALFPKVGDSKECPFRVGLITKDYIHHFGDLSCFVRGAIHVEYCEGDRSGLQEISQLNYNMEYVTTHLQEIPQRIR